MRLICRERQALGLIDAFARQDTEIHRLDARAKVLATAVFLLCVVSFPKHAVLPLLPFVFFPVVIASLGRLPLGWLGRRLLVASPFALMVGIANPLFDQDPVPFVPGLSLTAGWLSFVSIVLRFLLTTASALLLVATTGMPAIAVALRQLKVPGVFVTQLQLLYRYLFLLADEALRMERARDLRSCGRRGTGLWVSGTLLGALLLRTLARATRIHDAMQLRGFEGTIRPTSPRALTRRDLVFLLGWSMAFVTCRQVPVGELLGHAMIGARP